MSRPRRAAATLAVTSALLLTGCSEPALPTDPVARALQAGLSAWARANPDVAAVSGATACLLPAQGSAVTAAAGRVEQYGQPLSGGEWFHMGSVTKTYVAIALLRLAAKGRVDLDVPIDRYVDDVPGASLLTTRQLLAQTTGLPDFAATPAWLEAMEGDPSRRWTARDAIALVPAGDPVPGGFAYSNTNYVLAGLVLEAVSGQPALEAVRRLVVRPLGLDHTDVTGTGRPVVEGHLELPSGTVASTGDLGSYLALETSSGASGAMTSTSCGLAELGRALLDGIALDAPSLQAMTRFSGEGSYGLGLADFGPLTARQEPGLTGWGNYGEIPGFTALLVADPASGDVLAVMTNDDRTSGLELAAALQERLRGVRP